MTTERNYRDLWSAETLKEWEQDEDPGKVLDCWREAEGFFAPLAKLVEHSSNEALCCAVYDVQERVRSEVARWEEEVTMRLEWNKAHGRLTLFGRVLKPLMERAGFGSPRELLLAAGRIEEPNAVEVLERHMYGPETETRGAYLMGFPEALGIGDEDCSRLSTTLMHFLTREGAERAAVAAEAQYAARQEAAGSSPERATDRSCG